MVSLADSGDKSFGDNHKFAKHLFDNGGSLAVISGGVFNEYTPSWSGERFPILIPPGGFNLQIMHAAYENPWALNGQIKFVSAQLGNVACQNGLPSCGEPQSSGEYGNDSTGIGVQIRDEPEQKVISDWVFTGIVFVIGTYLWVDWCRREREYEENKKNWRE
jgi:hypothetical protein